MATVKAACNFTPVEQDNLWKSHLYQITKNQLYVWPSKWSFIVDEYQKMHDAMAGKKPLSPYDWSRSFSPYHWSNLPSADKPPAKKEVQHLYLPPIGDKPKRTTIPRTSSGWYGYVYLKDGSNLVYDRQRRTRDKLSKNNLVRVFNWPLTYFD